MQHARRIRSTLAVVALLAVSAEARADKPADADKPSKQKLADPAGREKTKEDRGRSAEAHAMAPGQADGARDKNEPAPDARDKREANAPRGAHADRHSEQTRDERRQNHRVELKHRYGLAPLQRPPIVAELKHHAWRVARLERMRVLAEGIPDAAKRKQTLERLDKLATKEQGRHERHMEQLKNQGDPASPTPAAEGAAKSPGLSKPEQPAKAVAQIPGNDRGGDR